MEKKNLPNEIAVFPLSNAIFFPRTNLPLNIFEDRYIQLVNDCMKKDRMFGMIQPKNKIGKSPETYKIGCLGKIINFNETTDKRFVISLSGIIRFRIKNELEQIKLYRKFDVDYSEFLEDLKEKQNELINYDKISFINKIKKYFQKIGYPIAYDELTKLDFEKLVNTVCMISPFSIEEKQKLIESLNIKDKINLLDEIINFNLFDYQENKTIQ